VQAPQVPELRVVGLQAHLDVALGVEDVRIGVERRERLVHFAGGRDHDLGVGQGQRLVERHAGVLADVEALLAVEPGHALDDDVLRRSGGREGEGRDERADGDGNAHSPVVGAWGRGLRHLAGCP
jgi:hypothetical protein